MRVRAGPALCVRASFEYIIHTHTYIYRQPCRHYVIHRLCREYTFRLFSFSKRLFYSLRAYIITRRIGFSHARTHAAAVFTSRYVLRRSPAVVVVKKTLFLLFSSLLFVFAFAFDAYDNYSNIVLLSKLSSARTHYGHDDTRAKRRIRTDKRAQIPF